MNKSPDFEEVTDRSQLDISEPYKVYRIVPEEEQKCECPIEGHGYWVLLTYTQQCGVGPVVWVHVLHHCSTGRWGRS